MNQFESVAKSLNDSLHLRIPPVALSFTDTPPPGVRSSAKPSPAGCAFWERGAQEAFVTSAQDHESCTVGMYTHHMPLDTPSRQKDLNDSLKVFADLGYVRPEDVAGIPMLKRRDQICCLRPAGFHSDAAGRCIALRQFAAKPGHHGGGPASRSGRASRHGTAGLRRDTTGRQHRQAGAQPWMLRRARLSERADRRFCALGAARCENR